MTIGKSANEYIIQLANAKCPYISPHAMPWATRSATEMYSVSIPCTILPIPPHRKALSFSNLSSLLTVFCSLPSPLCILYFLLTTFCTLPSLYYPLTSSASRNPFPSKLKASTSNIIAIPGANASAGLLVIMKL